MKKTTHSPVLRWGRALSYAAVLLVVLGTKVQAQDRDFAVSPIPDEVWEQMQGKTFHENPDIQREDLRYVTVLHVNFEGQTKKGELVCNQLIAEDLKEIFAELYAQRYPIERIELPDVYDADDEKQMRANNTSSFCYRKVAGTKVLSHHARGLAVDINTFYNPYCKLRQNGELYVQPATAASYCYREGDFPHKIDKNDLAYRLFKARGFDWGGDWQSVKDYQHFEKNVK